MKHIAGSFTGASKSSKAEVGFGALLVFLSFFGSGRRVEETYDLRYNDNNENKNDVVASMNATIEKLQNEIRRPASWIIWQGSILFQRSTPRYPAQC